jgi:glycine cleavage system aminomethyltransferase T
VIGRLGAAFFCTFALAGCMATPAGARQAVRAVVLDASIGEYEDAALSVRAPATGPLEAALGWAVDLDSGDFIGRDALAKQRDAGVERQLTGIRFSDASFLPAAGDEILLDGRAIGSVTSSDTGWALGVNLAMGYVDLPAVANAEVTVKSTESGASATGVTTDRAFYDPDRLLARTA